MIKQTFEFVAGKLNGLKFFDRVIPYAELIDDENGFVPCESKGQGNFTPINLGNYGSVAYLRKFDRIRFEKYSGENLTGDQEWDVMIIPMRAFMKVKSDLIQCDIAFRNEFLIEEFFRTVSGKSELLSDDATAILGEINFRSAETDRLKALTDEFGGSYLTDVHLDYILLSCDIEARLIFDKRCINKFCTDYA